MYVPKHVYEQEAVHINSKNNSRDGVVFVKSSSRIVPAQPTAGDGAVVNNIQINEEKETQVITENVNEESSSSRNGVMGQLTSVIKDVIISKIIDYLLQRVSSYIRNINKIIKKIISNRYY